MSQLSMYQNVVNHNRRLLLNKEYPEIPVAATIRFSGPFDGGYDAASEKLAGWMEQNGYGFSGPLRGYIVEPPGKDGDFEKCLTELQAPVEKKKA